jgi:hypothetical protein
MLANFCEIFIIALFALARVGTGFFFRKKNKNKNK